MSLKELNDLERILFLKEFTDELIISSAEDERVRRFIRIAKIKKKFVEPEKEVEKPSQFIKSMAVKSPLIAVKPPAMTVKPSLISMPIQPFQNVYPTIPEQTGAVDGMKKIESIIKDPSVQMIECSGAGKNILVKVRNKINVTKIILTNNEINDIINYFSESARIPVVAGILKAAVESLLISAVVSEYVGPRFIINKKSPYELIEGVSQ